MKKLLWFYLLVSGLLLFNGCQKEHSFENGAGPSSGSLQDDGAGDCLPKTVNGAYVVGTALDPAANYIEVTVDVTAVGSYTITTDTINGISFRATGFFTATGLNVVQLKGKGTPLAAGVSNFIVSYGNSGCSVAVTTSATLATFTLDGSPGGCTSAAPAGTYQVGVALTSANTVNISVNVSAVGAYNISTAVANGMTFSGSGVFATTGSQSIVLTASGTPTTAGTTNIPITAGSSSCSFPVIVQAAPSAAVFTFTCGSATINGTYTVGVPLAAANSIAITVDVTTAGTYSITGSVNNMTFSATGVFASTGSQTVTLGGTGTPNTAGTNTVSLSGATAACSVDVPVSPAASPAIFTINCPAAVVNGTYTSGTALTAGNTIGITVNVTTPGPYSITGALNGMLFSATGNFAAPGAANVTLAGSGTPTTAGANAVPLTGGSAICNVTVTVQPTTGGAAVFAVNCSSANAHGVYVKGQALVGSINTIDIDVDVTTVGTYTISTTPVNGISFTASGTFTVAGVQTIALAGSGTPTNSGTISIPVASGTTPCNFDLDIFPNLGTWSFNVGATNYSGVIVLAEMDNTAPPILAFYFLGTTPAGDGMEIDLYDLNGSIAANEVYNCAPPIASNVGGVYYDGVSGTSYYGDPVDPLLTANTMKVTVTSHNTGSKTISGTFTGKAVTPTSALVDITGGQFTVTYP